MNFFFTVSQSASMIKQFCYSNFFFTEIMCICFSSLKPDNYFQKNGKGTWYMYFLKMYEVFSSAFSPTGTFIINYIFQQYRWTC